MQSRISYKWKIFNHHFARRVSILLLGFMLACPAFATRILVLTTNEYHPSNPALPSIQANCIQEFSALQSSGAATVDVRGGILNTGTLTAADFAPAAGSYDLVVICTIFAQVSTANQAVIENAVKTRAAKAFFLFEELLNETDPAFLFDLVKNSKTGWTPTLVQQVYKNMTLNTSSKYHADFTGLDPYVTVTGRFYDGVPVDNALYLPPSQSIPTLPISPGQTVQASTIFVPQTESYLDGSNVPQGACIFYHADISGFDPPFPAANPPTSRYADNAGKIARAALNAIRPGAGACGIPAAAVPVGSTGWLLTLAALLTTMTLLGFRNQRA